MATANSSTPSVCANLEPNVYNLFPLAAVADQLVQHRPTVGHLYCRWGFIYLEDEKRIIHKLAELPAGMEAVCCENLDCENGIENGWYVGEVPDVRRVRRTMARVETQQMLADREQALADDAARQACYDAEYDEWLDTVEATETSDHGF